MTTSESIPEIRIGIDLGGTKIAGICLAPGDEVAASARRPTPHENYTETLREVAGMINEMETKTGPAHHIGVAMPGSIVPATGLVQNANSTWLNGRPFERDLADLLGRPVRTANDANCFALSEVCDGAAPGAASVFGVILGTGCGGGLVLDGRLIEGHRNIGGEWGHNPLPWPTTEELPGPTCWCGHRGCLETWVSGPALAADHERSTGERITAEDIVARASKGSATAQATLQRHASRLARGLAVVINIFDPEIIVLGGGLSEIGALYETLPKLIAPYVFAADRTVDIRRPRWGATSGVRGAARLWDAT